MEEGEQGNISLEGRGSSPLLNETEFVHVKGGRVSYGRFEDILAKKSSE